MRKVSKEFIDNLVPGNYWLTKSMEINKFKSSGALWYTKKFMVWYYIIFLSNMTDTREYVKFARERFDEYINTMDETVKENATKYFYPENEVINLKSDKFKLFSEFLGNNNYNNDSEKKEHLLLSKKYYFVSLMETGGQSGVKRLIKKNIYKYDFNVNKLPIIIKEYYKGKVSNKELRQIINDYHASLRNERQILYYYGFFHSKSTGAKDDEFSSLTPNGEIALYSNHFELQIIWEMQKIKMVSQPINVTIENIKLKEEYNKNFSLDYSPYIDLLESIELLNEVDLESYKYVISKMNNNNRERVLNNIREIIDQKDSIISRIRSFDRFRDTKDEDFRKEFLKYLLGLYDNKYDKGINIFSFLKMKKDNSVLPIEIVDSRKLNLMLNHYRKLNNYKLEKYGSIFEKCEDELRKKYYDLKNKGEYKIDERIKIDYDLYNIRPDINIIIGILCLIFDILDFEEDNFINYALINFNNILSYIGLKNEKELKDKFDIIKTLFYNNDYKSLIEDDYEDYKEVLAKHKSESSADLWKKIKNNNQKNDIYFNNARTRNSALVSLMKSLLIKNYSDENRLVRCECCGETTFITNSKEPYLEFHHLIPFKGSNGPDHYLNLYALCPSCHRKLHYISVDEKSDLYSSISKNNHLNFSLVKRLKELKKENLLKSYQLEFLLADNAINDIQYEEIIRS